MPPVTSLGLFPFCAKVNAQDGLPIEEWDGSTVYTFGTGGSEHLPSKSSSELIDVYNNTNDYPVGFTLSEMLELYWKRNWNKYDVSSDISMSHLSSSGYFINQEVTISDYTDNEIGLVCAITLNFNAGDQYDLNKDEPEPPPTNQTIYSFFFSCSVDFNDTYVINGSTIWDNIYYPRITTNLSVAWEDGEINGSVWQSGDWSIDYSNINSGSWGQKNLQILLNGKSFYVYGAGVHYISSGPVSTTPTGITGSYIEIESALANWSYS